MGNKLGRRRQVVEEKYTRPQGLYQIKDVDYKKLKKLILESKLAPCYPGGDECDCGILEECPICFLYYPTLNRSRCCMKSICTECFLQMKNPNSTTPTQCPFCKTANYAVEYRGVKSKEERGMEQIEEQKVIEAKLRMRQEELLEEEERQRRKEEIGSSNREGQTGNPDSSPSQGIECEEIAPSQDSRATQTVIPERNTRQNRDDEVDLDLEDIMVMEAIWLSIQENGRSGHPSNGDAVVEHYASREHSLSPARALEPGSSSLDMLPSSSRSTSTKRVKKSRRNHPESSSSSAKEMCSSAARMSAEEECGDHHASEVAEVGTSYASSDEFKGEAALGSSPPPPPPLHRHRRKSKRVKNDQRKKYASLERASSNKDTCGERMLAEEWKFDYGEVGTTYGSSDESSTGMRGTTALPPPPLLYGSRNSKRVKNNRRKYPPLQKVFLKDTCGEEWEFDYGSVVAEVGTTYGSSDESDIGGARPTTFLPPPPPPPPPPVYDEGGTSGSCSDYKEEDGGEYLALPPPPPPQFYGWWPSALPSPVQ